MDWKVLAIWVIAGGTFSHCQCRRNGNIHMEFKPLDQLKQLNQ